MFTPFGTPVETRFVKGAWFANRSMFRSGDGIVLPLELTMLGCHRVPWPNMDWLIQSRLRTALAVLMFAATLVVSIRILWDGVSKWVFEHTGLILGGGGGGGRVDQTTLAISALTALTGLLGTVSTLVLAWRTDRRSTAESRLKLVQMEQQILELERKLKSDGKDTATGTADGII